MWDLVIVTLVYLLFFLFFVLTFSETSESNNNNDDLGTVSALKAKVRSDFDWRAYLELFPDIADRYSTREEAIVHYLKFGRKEGKRFVKVFPSQPALGFAKQKLLRFLDTMEERKVEIEDRTFIIYYLDHFDPKNSLEVAINNVRIFTASVLHDNGNDSTHFYWFNVIGGVDNVLRPHLPLHEWNVAEVEWPLAPSDMFTHFRTLGVFKYILETRFGSVLFTNNMIRGPFQLAERGSWIKHFRRLLFTNNIGLIGPTLSCQYVPHIQTHLFMIRSFIIPTILIEFSTFRKFADAASLRRRYEEGLTELTQKSGWNISSLMYLKRLKKPVFDGFCLPKPSNFSTATLDPTRWCDVKVEEVIVFKWGGEMLSNNLLCDRAKTYMMQLVADFQRREPSVQLLLPETLKGGQLFHLYQDYDAEMWAEARRYQDHGENSNLTLSEKVCFLVRTSTMHDISPSRSLVETVVADGIDGLIRSLLRQTDPNWEAVFFITDEKPFDMRLQSIVQQYNESRVVYFEVPLRYRPVYSKTDAGYTATDYVLSHVLQREDCRWIAATNADNIYGTQVVENVRNTLLLSKRADSVPDLVLAPLDSRNIVGQDFWKRRSSYAWDEHCVGILATFDLHELGYVVQPRPRLTKVDLAAAFFSRPKLLSENVLFGNFTNPIRFRCRGCQDGYFTEYLVRGRLWTYKRLPIDGMKSVVFHGPSLTWCIAGGHIWFDHPDIDKVRCYAHSTVEAIRALDSRSHSIFDWKSFDRSDRLCLRLSKLGFSQNA